MNRVFHIVCWIVAAYFAASFVTAVGFPPSSVVTSHWPLLVMFLIFFLLPVAKKLEIFQFFTFERQLEHVQNQVNDAQDQIRHIQSLQATLTNKVVNNYYAGVVREEQKEAETGISTVSETVKNRSAHILLETFERPPTETLIMLRVDLEKELRVLLKKRTEFYEIRKPAKYLSLRSLADAFLREFPQYDELSPSFSFFANIANAAAHGQNLPEEIAREAINIGTKLYAQVVLLNEGNPDVEHVRN